MTGRESGWMPDEALPRAPWALWQRDPAKELCCDKSDSQPYFYSSINLIKKKEKKRRQRSKSATEVLSAQEMSRLLLFAALVKHPIMAIIYFC